MPDEPPPEEPGDEMPLTTPLYPTGTLQTDMDFASLVEGMVADKIFFGMGKYTAAEATTAYATQTALTTETNTNMDSLGELAEKPGKADSKVNKLKSRNYLVPGKRTNTIELTIIGLQAKQKNFLESRLFSGKEVTITLVSAENDRAVVFNGMRWAVEWSGEADGMFSVVISTEYSGATKDRIFLFKDIPAT
jgi:hypothetical protein